MARLIRNILHDNSVEIHDSITRSAPIAQTNGVLQGDPLSPILFIIATADVIQSVTSNRVMLYMFADDMVLASQSHEELQESFSNLVKWAQENDLHLNEQKTVMMTFRRGGKPATRDTIFNNDRPLKVVTSFKYLGVTFQTRGISFTMHVKDKINIAIRAMSDIKNLSKTSITTAMKLFNLKIKPVITYGLELTWDYLTKGNLSEIEKVKSTFLKKILCISKFSRSRLAYALANESFFIEDLRLQLLLPATAAYNALLSELETKRLSIESDFYVTDAMTTQDWKRGNYELKHIMTRFAVHGFHHKICSNKKYHTPDLHLCICELCKRQCDKYHVMYCEQRVESLTKFCSD